MTVDSKSFVTDNTVSCPLTPVLLLLVDEVRDLSDKVDEIHRILDGKETKTEKSTAKRSKTTVHRQHVNEKIIASLLKNPEKVWTSEDW